MKNTWIPKFKDGMLSYSKKDKSEWTNNALERYHQRLQQRLTKNPNLQKFVVEIQGEEKYYLDKYFESLKYGNSFLKQSQTLKRKKADISLDNSTSAEKEITSKTKHFRINTESLINTNLEQSIPIRLRKPEFSNYEALIWIKWKNYSCRIDAFSTVSYFIFYHEFQESIFPILLGPTLPGEVHPLGILLQEIHNAPSINVLQKAVDNFVSYRSKAKNEKPGKGAAISALFSEFKSLSYFTWKFKTTYKCDCGENYLRTFESEPLISLPSSMMIQNAGSCKLSITV